MQYNKISGSTIDTPNTLLFKEFENERCYLAFLRGKESWGNCALVNISLNGVEIKDIVANNAGEAGVFHDLNRDNGTPVDIDRRVYIYKTTNDKQTFSGNTDDYVSISQLESYDLRLQYINSSWAVIKGLPINYNEFINLNTNDKFYLIRNDSASYPVHPDNLTAICKINPKSTFDTAVSSTPAVLNAVKYSLVGTPPVNTLIETNAVYGIDLETNLLGETIITGANDTNVVISDEVLLSDFSVDKNQIIDVANQPYFILRQSVNLSNKIFDRMYLIKTVDVEGNNTVWHYSSTGVKYLLFSTTTIFGQKLYIKISTEVSANELAIYHESLPYVFNVNESANNISDANPPGLDSTYLKNQENSDSMFDVLGLVKIRKAAIGSLSTEISSSVSFAREMKDNNELNNYKNQYGFTETVDDATRIEYLDITSASNIVHYGNIRPNPHSLNGDYPLPVTRLYLYTNNFVIGDKITIRYYMTNTDYSQLDNQSRNSVDERLTITGISYVEDNYYIELNGATSLPIIFNPSYNFEASANTSATIVSDPTNIVIRSIYAVCDNIVDANRYKMNKVMVNMKLPTLSTVGLPIYDGIYRQLAIVHQPKYNSNSGTDYMKLCTADTYVETDNLPREIFDNGEHKYDIGTVLFLANKLPIYRKYLSDREIFKLII